MLQPGGLADRAGRQEILGEDLLKEVSSVRSAMKKLLAEIPRRFFEPGNFALIEWLGLYVAGESTERDLLMGLGYNKWLSHHEILDAVTKHLAGLEKEHLEEMQAPISRRAAISWVYGIILQTLLEESFHPCTQFYCLKGINWSTGHYLMHKEAIVEKEPLLQMA